jgi:hypothetical protein
MYNMDTKEGIKEGKMGTSKEERNRVQCGLVVKLQLPLHTVFENSQISMYLCT